MRKKYRRILLSLFVFAALLAGVVGANFAFAHGHNQHTSHAQISGRAKAATARVLLMHRVNMKDVPAGTPQSASHRPTAQPFLTGVSAPVYAQRKAAAAHNLHAVRGSHANAAPTVHSTDTPTASKHFQGMADSASTCPYFGGCQPPDQALAVSTSWVLQGVNTSFAVYNTSGTLQSGWPKNAQTFFGVPNPGSCDSNGPFLSDPRAFYDPNDGRFWVAMLQVEGAFGLNSCPFLTRYWIAVSQTGDPRGSWHVYTVDMSLGTSNAADYTQFAFDQQAIYISANMFNQAGSAYQYAEIFGANKSRMEQGLAVSFFGFFQLSVSNSTTVLVDTVQPVEAQARKVSGPGGGMFINSWNMYGDPFGDDCFSTICHGLALWTITNPGTSSDGLSFAFTDTAGYILPPNADEPGCSQCIESLDTRISATPSYHNGLISFGLETGINNGSQVVPGIFWGQVAPQLNDTGALSGAFVSQSGYYFYSGDGAATFGALMPDADGDLFMLFEFMSSSSNPGVAYTARRVTLSPGVFHDGGFYLHVGSAPTFNSRWGDYEATSYDGFSKDNVWFSGEYSAANNDWSTFIGRDNFCATCN